MPKQGGKAGNLLAQFLYALCSITCLPRPIFCPPSKGDFLSKSINKGVSLLLRNVSYLSKEIKTD